MFNRDFDRDVDGDTNVPVTQGSRIPVPVERQTNEGPSRIPVQPESFRTPPRNMGYVHGRQEAPRGYQPYNIAAPTSNSTTLRPRDCQCPIHCPKKRPNKVPIYSDSLVLLSSGMWQVHDLPEPRRSGIWQVHDLPEPRRSGIAARSEPRGTLKTAGGRRGHRQR